MKFGVLQFPGSCDEVDALQAARRVGDAELLWHGDESLQGVDAIVPASPTPFTPMGFTGEGVTVRPSVNSGRQWALGRA